MVLDGFKNKLYPLEPTEGRGNLGMLSHVARVSDRSNLRILTAK